jgi:hypothetical protein
MRTMNRTQRTTRLAVLVALVATLAVPAPAFAQGQGQGQTENNGNGGNSRIDMITSEIPALVKGGGAWVALNYTTGGGEVRDVRITVEARTAGISIRYPENTRDHTSFWADDTLSDGEIDYSAFHLDVPATVDQNKANLQLVITGTTDRGPLTQRLEVLVPLVAYTGENIEQITDTLQPVTTGETAWVEVALTGLAPMTSGISSTVAADGVAIIYPGDRSSTSLHHDDVLDGGETDVIRFVVDAQATQPGVYDLVVTTGFEGGSIEGSVSVEVLPPA